MKILLIDDDADLLEMSTRRFTKKGLEVDSAQNLTAARKILIDNNSIKAIVCDLFLLDGENGLDFFEKEIKKQFNGKFILATGDDMADPRIEKFKNEDPKFTCFQKPYSIDEMMKYIEQ